MKRRVALPQPGSDAAIVLDVLHRFTNVRPAEFVLIAGLDRDDIYRTLDRLRRIGLVEKIDSEDGARYALGPNASVPQVTHFMTEEQRLARRARWGESDEQTRAEGEGSQTECSDRTAA